MRTLETMAAGLLAITFVGLSVAPSLALPETGSIVVADTPYRSDSFRHHFYRGQYNHGEHAGKPRFGSGEMHRGYVRRVPAGSLMEADVTPPR